MSHKFLISATSMLAATLLIAGCPRVVDTEGGSGGTSASGSGSSSDYLAGRDSASYLPPSGGTNSGTEFRMISWSMPHSAAPGETVSSTIVWETARGNPNAVIYATVIGDWAPSAPLATIVNAGKQGPPGTRFDRSFNFTAPSARGSYKVRWILVQAFAPLTHFYGHADGDAYAPQGGTWSQLDLTVGGGTASGGGSSGSGSSSGGSTGGGSSGGGSGGSRQSNFEPGTYQGLVVQESDIFSGGQLIGTDERSSIQSITVNSQGLLGFSVGDRIVRWGLTTEVTSVSVSTSGDVIRLYYDAWGTVDGVGLTGSGSEFYTWLSSTDSIMFSGSVSVRTTNQSPELRQDSTLRSTLVRW